MTEAIERVVAYLYDRYDQPISLADMAEVAILSQFHFARTFREVTGVSPGRFLSAVPYGRARAARPPGLLRRAETRDVRGADRPRQGR